MTMSVIKAPTLSGFLCVVSVTTIPLKMMSAVLWCSQETFTRAKLKGQPDVEIGFKAKQAFFVSKAPSSSISLWQWKTSQCSAGELKFDINETWISDSLTTLSFHSNLQSWNSTIHFQNIFKQWIHNTGIPYLSCLYCTININLWAEAMQSNLNTTQKLWLFHGIRTFLMLKTSALNFRYIGK